MTEAWFYQNCLPSNGGPFSRPHPDQWRSAQQGAAVVVLGLDLFHLRPRAVHDALYHRLRIGIFPHTVVHLSQAVQNRSRRRCSPPNTTNSVDPLPAQTEEARASPQERCFSSTTRKSPSALERRTSPCFSPVFLPCSSPAFHAAPLALLRRPARAVDAARLALVWGTWSVLHRSRDLWNPDPG